MVQITRFNVKCFWLNRKIQRPYSMYMQELDVQFPLLECLTFTRLGCLPILKTCSFSCSVSTPGGARISLLGSTSDSAMKMIIQSSFTQLAKGWHSTESTCLTTIWAEFNSQTRGRMWIEFVGSVLCSEGFFSG